MLADAILGHYAIGIVLATLYVWGTGEIGWPRSLGIALAFGLCPNALPWLLMFPAMGFGFFVTHGPDGTRLFVSSLMSHAFFDWVSGSPFVSRASPEPAYPLLRRESRGRLRWLERQRE